MDLRVMTLRRKIEIVLITMAVKRRTRTRVYAATRSQNFPRKTMELEGFQKAVFSGPKHHRRINRNATKFSIFT